MTTVPGSVGCRQWRRQDLVSGGTTMEALKARASSRQVGWGMVWGGVSAVQPTMGSRGASSASPVGSGVKPRPSAAIAFSAYFRPRNASGSKKNTVKKYCET